ncbi:MerR family transcriptional regulator [Cognatishimia sp. F0-27]|uniref:MerR family transcriptional regulator n=1 Tax=Cognatishimia sp. F0-27 TaxID=2816855 RepID=UPI001D0CD789|nr:MerR family transcriptional regulator [Cognatishimia sp. F0-27]MCC1494948.1 MerR family transcriptional regulator [Cognatishimia sp. F0-27]
MKYSVRTITHEYSPSEVARVSGVSTSLQRDWRRRGVIQGRADGWNKYDLADVIRMTVMRAFTQSGISLETAESVSSLAVLPVMDELVRWDDVAVFTGDQLSAEQMDQIRGGHVRGASGDEQFTFVALPENEQGASAARLRNLADGERIMGKSGNFYGIALDHSLLAHRIAELSPLPIIRFEVEVKDDG